MSLEYLVTHKNWVFMMLGMKIIALWDMTPYIY
jgi:hypothetical protein